MYSEILLSKIINFNHAKLPQNLFSNLIIYVLVNRGNDILFQKGVILKIKDKLSAK